MKETTTMPRVLVLDDEVYRHDGMDKLFEGAHITHVWTVDQAILALQNNLRFDMVCLDNDLATESYHREGREVATFISKMPPALRPLEVLIHSWNSDAARWMQQVLTDVGFEPIMAEFGSFKGRIDDRGHIHIFLLPGKFPDLAYVQLLGERKQIN